MAPADQWRRMRVRVELRRDQGEWVARFRKQADLIGESATERRCSRAAASCSSTSYRWRPETHGRLSGRSSITQSLIHKAQTVPPAE
jgi:hypothetical protein